MKVTTGVLAKGTRFETFFYTANSGAQRSTTFITAGVHGNERASAAAASRLVEEIKQDRIRLKQGTLIVVPVVNREAYGARIRGEPDLNRTFPPPGTMGARHPLSASLFLLAKRMRPAWYIDLHEANGLSSVQPGVLGQTLIANPGSNAIPAVRQIAQTMNRSIPEKARHFNVRLRELPGSGRHAAFHMLQANAVTVETCWSLPMPIRIAYQTAIVKLLLRQAGLI